MAGPSLDYYKNRNTIGSGNVGWSGTHDNDRLDEREEAILRSYAEMIDDLQAREAAGTIPAGTTATYTARVTSMRDRMDNRIESDETSDRDLAAITADRAAMDATLATANLTDDRLLAGGAIATSFRLDASQTRDVVGTGAESYIASQQAALFTVLQATGASAPDYNAIIAATTSAIERGVDVANIRISTGVAGEFVPLDEYLLAEGRYGMSVPQSTALAAIIAATPETRAGLVDAARRLPDARGDTSPQPTDVIDRITLTDLTDGRSVETLSVQVLRNGSIEGLSSPAEFRAFLGELENTMPDEPGTAAAADRIIAALPDAAARAAFRADLLAEAAAHNIPATDERLVAALAIVDAEIAPPPAAPSFSYGLQTDFAEERTKRIDDFEVASLAANLSAMGYDVGDGSHGAVQTALQQFAAAHNAANPGEPAIPADITLDQMYVATSRDNFNLVNSAIADARADGHVRTGATVSNDTIDLRTLDSDTIKQIQQTLGVEPADGIAGPATIRAFNEALDLPRNAAPVIDADRLQAFATRADVMYAGDNSILGTTNVSIGEGSPDGSTLGGFEARDNRVILTSALTTDPSTSVPTWSTGDLIERVPTMGQVQDVALETQMLARIDALQATPTNLSPQELEAMERLEAGIRNGTINLNANAARELGEVITALQESGNQIGAGIQAQVGEFVSASVAVNGTQRAAAEGVFR